MGANELCSICRTISFGEEDSSSIIDNTSLRRNWTILDIRNQPDCPLCRLALVVLESDDSPPSSTRPISLQWFGGSKNLSVLGYACARLYIVQEPSSILPKHQLALPVTRPKIDLQRARGWLDWCLSRHKQCGAQITDFPGPTTLRLINVVTRCIEEVRMPCKYIALSYVWGGVSSIRLTTNTKASMSEPGILTKISRRIPRTIRDAIEAVQGLNEKYLWVDSLCLIQNDSADVKNGVAVMDLIYERAMLTIIAASGGHANAGLPGVGSTCRSNTQRIEQIRPGVRLACHLDANHLLKQAVYSQRGWTFQEQILSRRSLVFMNNQVYFQCRQHQYSEDIIDPTGRYNPAHTIDSPTSLLPVVTALQDPLADYDTMLMYYSERTFSDQNDALLAVAGISRRISQRVRCSFFQGCPIVAFDAFIAFHNHGSILRRRRQFPSYTWAGWIGRILSDFGAPGFHGDVNYWLHDWLRDCTWIRWYKRSPNGAINPIWDVTADNDFPTEKNEFVGYDAKPRFGDRFNVDSTRTAPTEALTSSSELPPYPILQFWTVSVHFEIYKFDVFEASAAIIDCKGIKCGRLSMDGFEDDEFFQPGASYEFILVSQSYSSTDPGCGCGDVHTASSRPYNVLVLEWKGGIAERRGMGELCGSGVERALPPGPCWKEILLQ